MGGEEGYVEKKKEKHDEGKGWDGKGRVWRVLIDITKSIDGTVSRRELHDDFFHRFRVHEWIRHDEGARMN